MNFPCGLILLLYLTDLKFMRIVGEVAHPHCKITIFNWNGKFLVKFEQGLVEQTYKISEMDIASPEEVNKLAAEPFIGKVLSRFEEMQKDLFEAMENMY